MNWSRGSIVGHGSSATISVATSLHSGDIFAVKSSEFSRSENLQREQRILSSLCYPYVVTYKGCEITREKSKLFYNLFMEYMPLGTLIQATRRPGGRKIHEPAIACYTRQVVQGLQYLHSNGLVHCDIKGANILVCEDGAKIADFGCAKMAAEPATAISGTPMFMSPEAARGEEQGFPCDIWALGCTVIEVFSGVSPWPNVGDAVSLLYRIAYSGEVPEIPGFLSEEAKDFLGKCLRRNPRERWTASQLLKHPFLSREFNSENCKQVQESNNSSSSSSPTSILEKGFWNCVEELESESVGNWVHTRSENSPAGRIKDLAMCSGDPIWIEDEDWITTRGNNDEEEEEEMLEKSDVSGRGISEYFCDNYNYKYRQVSFLTSSSSVNFERGIDEVMLLHDQVSIFL